MGLRSVWPRVLSDRDPRNRRGACAKKGIGRGWGGGRSPVGRASSRSIGRRWARARRACARRRPSPGRPLVMRHRVCAQVPRKVKRSTGYSGPQDGAGRATGDDGGRLTFARLAGCWRRWRGAGPGASAVLDSAACRLPSTLAFPPSTKNQKTNCKRYGGTWPRVGGPRRST